MVNTTGRNARKCRFRGRSKATKIQICKNRIKRCEGIINERHHEIEGLQKYLRRSLNHEI